MNSAVELSFKIVFTKKTTCESREQCMRPTEKQRKRGKHYPNSTSFWLLESSTALSHLSIE